MLIKQKIYIGDKYDYSSVEYVDSRSKINVKCIKHNIFFTPTANDHLKGTGCPKCAKEGPGGLGMYNDSYFIKNHNVATQKGYMYFLKIFNENEIFYKIGITLDRKINKRISNIKKDSKHRYYVECLCILYGQNIQYYYELEQYYLRNKFIDYKYTPQYTFKGYSECISINVLDSIFNG